MSVSERLRQERKRLGLTQLQLAAVAGISNKTQIAYERGTSHPTTGYLNAIAEAFPIDAIYVLTGKRELTRCITLDDLAEITIPFGRKLIDALNEFLRVHADARAVIVPNDPQRAERVLREELERIVKDAKGDAS